MANKTKNNKSAARDRRAKVEAMRREQQSRERRKSIVFIVLAVVLGLGLVAAATIPAYLDRRDDPANQSLSSFGVPAADASCGEVTNDESSGTGDHKADGTTIDYDEVPPSHGPHWDAPTFPSRAFYTADDRPEMERLVHNLEHGYTILWYDETITGDQLQELEDLSAAAREQDAVGTGQKFIVSAWDDSYGEFPEGKHLALAHWGAESAHRQLCGQLSGAAVQDFIDSFPFSDSPEPNAA